MSADNKLLISKKTFEVKEMNMSTGHLYSIAQGKDLEDAIRIAEEFDRDKGVEYGIGFYD